MTVKWYGNQVFTLATEANIKAMKKAAHVVEKYVKTHFTLQGSGKTVKGIWKPGKGRKKTKSGKRHFASAPGEPPAIDIGTLRASIMSEVEQHGYSIDGRVGPDVHYIWQHAGVGTDENYGLYLEMGTSRMRPRPFLRPAIRITAHKILKIFKEANS